ncbi:MAG: transcription repressor NadR [Lachnospiraceae bacterium]|jgi:transcriptional regulator of NAD metabolism|nr:transcription repressor NadR [Lachnospiraceae bacterium]MEE3460346.1 transcription repressor NadR [Lachnospiraceae bacterium]
MNGEERRTLILQKLGASDKPISGSRLSNELGVSRQVIVQDIALLRSSGHTIYSFNKGYQMGKKSRCSRVFKDIHTDEQAEDELSTIIDLGGIVEDVFIYHRVYGVLKGDLNIRTHKDIDDYIEKIKTGKSKLLMHNTSGYHYHTVTAETNEALDAIQGALGKKGYLAKLQDYEPVDFWSDKDYE